MSLDVADVAQQMLGAALPLLEKDASDAESFAKTEFLKIAQTMAGLEEQLEAGQIDSQQAALLFDIQKGASRNVLLALQGLSLLAVEAAIDAALAVVKTVVNTALGFSLIA